MIEQPNVNQFERRLQTPGDHFGGLGGLGDSARVLGCLCECQHDSEAFCGDLDSGLSSSPCLYRRRVAGRGVGRVTRSCRVRGLFKPTALARRTYKGERDNPQLAIGD
jgi:hypothetical protein